MEFLLDYDIDIAYHPIKSNVMANPLSRRPITCGVRLAVTGRCVEDQLSNVSNRWLVVFMARLTISLTILESIRLAYDKDE